MHTLGSVLLLEGGLVSATLRIRALCLRGLPLETVPQALKPRIVRRNRLAPIVMLLAVAAVAIGGVLLVAS